MSPPRTLDVVVPVYNEARGIAAFHQALIEAVRDLDWAVAIRYVDDGSTDGTADVLREIARTDARVALVQLSRNFGHQAALSAGLDLSTADAVVTLDGDGQHPPELIPQMVRLCEGGYDVVLGQRVASGAASQLKRWTSAAFYWLLSRISDTPLAPGAADYRLMTRPVVDALRQMREHHRFLRGMVAWLGFPTVILPYRERARLAGQSKYSLGKMLRLAGAATFSFSLVPLRVGIGLGFAFLLLAFGEVLYVLSFWWRGRSGDLVRGWSSLMFMLLLVGGIVMLLVGFIGIYVGYIFQEVKRRPVYVVREPGPAAAAPSAAAGGPDRSPSEAPASDQARRSGSGPRSAA